MRLSVTDLDLYLSWLEMEEGPEWLVDRLTIFEPTEAMKAGSALHKVLENLPSAKHEVSGHVADGFTFQFDLDFEIEIPSIRELKFEQEVLPGVTLVGKVDSVLGDTVRDYKLTERFDAERYMGSYQWRAYLYLSGLPVFEYLCFEGVKDRSIKDHRDIRDCHTLRLYRYPELERHVLGCVGDLASFVTAYNVQSKLEQKVCTNCGHDNT